MFTVRCDGFIDRNSSDVRSAVELRELCRNFCVSRSPNPNTSKQRTVKHLFFSGSRTDAKFTAGRQCASPT
jgi:hypothetical protein